MRDRHVDVVALRLRRTLQRLEVDADVGRRVTATRRVRPTFVPYHCAGRRRALAQNASYSVVALERLLLAILLAPMRMVDVELLAAFAAHGAVDDAVWDAEDVAHVVRKPGVSHS